MPVELAVVESTTEVTLPPPSEVVLEQTVITVNLLSASAPGPQGPPGTGGVIDADYLVGTAHGTLTNEIVVGATPGGELGGTWASPTVDATHSGSSHASVQAAAEATAAAALATHTADTTAVHGIADTSALVVDGDAAGGVLAGTYPNPSFAADMATQAELDAHVNDTTDAHAATAIAFTPDGSIAATTVQAAIVEVRDEASGAPATVDYLVGTADGGLSNEIVVGTSPGGELGGTWASPTVDATHSGSSHAAVQAAAEATAAAALTTHAADTTAVHGIADTSVLATDSEVATAVSDHSADTTSVHGIADTSALALTANHPSNATFNDHSARHENGGADEISIAGLDGTPTELTNHLNDSSDAHDASAISVVSTTLSGTGTDVQAVFEEIDNLLDDHSARHENGGADEMSIAGLDGTPTELTNHLNDTSAAHAASAISFTPNGSIAATDVQAAIQEVRDEAGGGGSGTDLSRDINQATHGLSVGNIVRFNGTNYVKAQANSVGNAEVVGIVSEVADTDNFTLHFGGRITTLSGLTAGSVYFLDDDTAGLLTTTEPTDGGDVSKPLLVADSTTSGYFVNYRGMVAGGTGDLLWYAI